jgi:putative transposase
MAGRAAWRMTSRNSWWSEFGKRKARGRGNKAGPPLVFSIEIHGYSIDSRMKPRLVVNAIDNAAASRSLTERLVGRTGLEPVTEGL